MNAVRIRKSKVKKRGATLTGSLLIMILGILGTIFFLTLIYLTSSLLRQYFQFKKNSTISGQSFFTLEVPAPLFNNILVKQIPVIKTISKVNATSQVAKLSDPVSQVVKQLAPESQAVEQSDPVMRLKIPKIKVDTLVESVGVIANGEMALPRGSNNVAWFNLGPRPGEIGSAVIDGHYGVWQNGESAVFNDLTKLEIGDEILIEDGNGSTTVFIVRGFKSLDDKEDATSIFNSSDGKAHLNLITCSGDFDKISKSYPSRLVILSDKK
jgi:LPXTG-site transpeptidase (sortase) family protein